MRCRLSVCALTLTALAGCSDSPSKALEPIADLPADLAAISFTVHGRTTEPYTMLELRRPNGFSGFVAIDRAGRVVWFHRSMGTSSSHVRRANGNFVFLDGQRGLIEVAPSGDVVRSLAQEVRPGRRIHHDATVTSQNTILFIAEDSRPWGGELMTGEALWEWNPEAGTVIRRWSSFAELDPEKDWGALSTRQDWLHANSVSIGPRGNVLVSFHYLNQVISIAPDFGKIEWRLGGIRGTIGVDDPFSGQHTAQATADSRVLLFDNGYERTANPFSRAVEYEIRGSKAEKVWQWRPPTDNWARILSGVRRIRNGNSMVTFGTSRGLVEGATGPIEAFEVSSDGRVVWHLKVDGAVSSMYRATPIRDL